MFFYSKRTRGSKHLMRNRSVNCWWVPRLKLPLNEDIFLVICWIWLEHDYWILGFPILRETNLETPDWWWIVINPELNLGTDQIGGFSISVWEVDIFRIPKPTQYFKQITRYEISILTFTMYIHLYQLSIYLLSHLSHLHICWVGETTYLMKPIDDLTRPTRHRQVPSVKMIKCEAALPLLPGRVTGHMRGEGKTSKRIKLGLTYCSWFCFD